MAPKYRTVRVPESLVESVLNLMEEMNELGYHSHSEFIIESIRRRVEDLIKLNLEMELNDNQ